tara:strand:- start:37246 stop:37875 length:630 start_codon:yes stop_codon:yes gene_type:complete
MALQSSGSVIKMSQIATEFGGSAPHSLSEYYKNGGLVPNQAIETVTASSLGGSNSNQPGARTPQFGGHVPQINTFGRLYTQALWGDNGSTITMDRNFTVDKAGTYNYYVAYYIQGVGSATVSMYANGSLIRSHTLSPGYNQTASASNTLTLGAGQVIRTVGSGPSSGWAAITVHVGGSSTSNNTLVVSNNSNLPTSGLISMSNFYGSAA